MASRVRIHLSKTQIHLFRTRLTEKTSSCDEVFSTKSTLTGGINRHTPMKSTDVDEIRLDGGRVDLISSRAKRTISSGYSPDFTATARSPRKCRLRRLRGIGRQSRFHLIFYKFKSICQKANPSFSYPIDKKKSRKSGFFLFVLFTLLSSFFTLLPAPHATFSSEERKEKREENR